MYSFIVCEICLSYLTCFCLIPKMTFDIQYKYMSIIIFYQNTSTMLYSTIPKPSPSQRLSHLSPFQSFPHLPVNFLLGAGRPWFWSVGEYNLFLMNCTAMIVFYCFSAGSSCQSLPIHIYPKWLHTLQSNFLCLQRKAFLGYFDRRVRT